MNHINRNANVHTSVHVCAHAAGIQCATVKHRCSNSHMWRENHIFFGPKSFKRIKMKANSCKDTIPNSLVLDVLDVWLSNISVMLRKSYEFEDLLQSSSDSCRVDWYAQSRLGLTRTLSEENVYEDIIGKLDIVTSFALTWLLFSL